MIGSIKKYGVTTLALVLGLAGVVLLAGCGGSDDSSSADSASAGQTAGTPGGMFASLTDDQKQCLEDAGVTMPEAGDAPPEGEMPQGTPPQGTTSPEGAPDGASSGESPPEGMTSPSGGQAPEGMDELQSAMEDCGIEMPEPPQGEAAPESGATGSSDAVESSAA